MANEYNELEQLVNDVTNIDTARMTLRWALERLNSIEKERAELKKNLISVEDTKKGLELKVQSLEDTFKSRGKSLEEKEGFYTKLEATMSLLGDGKLDIQQLLKKEAKLDHLRLELENEYQDKFEELDKNQSSVIERWNARLLDVEGQYAKRLSEAQVRYDSLRAELEADYQARLGNLDRSYQHKEKELTERIKTLEASLKAGGDTLEGRRKELETEFFGKKNEIEANYRKLKSVLEENFEARARSMENDHCAQIKSLEHTWNSERERLMAEQRARDEQFEQSQFEMARLEAELSEQQEKHHTELLDIISKKEDAFRAKVESLEKEKTAYEAAVKKLMVQLENKENEWLASKEQLNVEFSRRCAEMEASVRERGAALERDTEARKEELKKEASARVETARLAMEEEVSRLAEHDRVKESELAQARASIRKLEDAISLSVEEHHQELMAKIRGNEEAFRAKLDEFEAEKEEYKKVIAALVDQVGTKDAVLIEERKRLQNEFNAKYASLEAELSARDAKAGEEKAALHADFAARTRLLEKGLMEREGVLESRYQLKAQELDKKVSEIRALLEADFNQKLAVEKQAFENTKANLAETDKMREEQLSNACRLADELVEKAKSDYDNRKVELERQCEEKLSAASSALEFERSTWQTQNERLEGLLAATVEDFKHVQNETKGLSDALSHKEDEISKLKAEMAEKARQSFEALRFAESEVLSNKAAELEAAYMERKERLESEAAALKEALKNDYRNRQEELAKDLESRTLPLKLENEALKKTVQAMREEVAGAAVKAEAYVNEKVESAAAKATQLLQEKLRFMENELSRVEQHNKDERRIIEETFHKERERMMEDLNRKNKYIEVVDFKIQEMENDLMKNRQNAATNLLDQDEVFKALVCDFELRQAKLEEDGARCVEERKARLENETAALRTALEKEYWRKQEELAKDLEAKTLPLRLENEALKKTIEKMREEVASAAAKAEGYVNEKVESAAAKATQLLQEKLRFMESELSRMEKYNKDERRIIEETFNKERERVAEELGRKNNYIEVVDFKIREMENELLKTRQNSVVTFLSQITDQDDKFKLLVTEYESRQEKLEMETAARIEEVRAAAEARFKEMDAMLKAKENLLREGAEFWRQKESELDAQNSEVNMKMHRFNEELFAQKQELSAKEKQLNEYRLGLEKDHAARLHDIENLKIELTRAIMEYKNRK